MGCRAAKGFPRRPAAITRGRDPKTKRQPFRDIGKAGAVLGQCERTAALVLAVRGGPIGVVAVAWCLGFGARLGALVT